MRVRMKDDRAYLTIKGKNDGIRRLEFEYDADTEQISLTADGATMIFQKITDETEINRMKSKRKHAVKE